jgi:hypothetical protein
VVRAESATLRLLAGILGRHRPKEWADPLATRVTGPPWALALRCRHSVPYERR